MADTPFPPESPGDAGDLAADALRAAQEAVASLKQNTTPPVAASGGDDAAAAALLAAQQAIAAAKAINTPPPPPPSAAAMGVPPIPPGAIPMDAYTSSGGQTQYGVPGGMPAGPTPQPVNLPSFGAASPVAKPEGIDLLSDVNLNVKIELGRTRMLVEDVLRLGEGSVVELDKLAGDPVDVYVNDRHVARGEVLVLNDNFCVRINEIVATVGEGAERGRR
jgi:flagellar motor switch protein FliN/FliY